MLTPFCRSSLGAPRRTDNAVKNRYMALIKKGSQEDDQDTSHSRDVSQCNTPAHHPGVVHAFPNSPKPNVCRPEPVRLPPNGGLCRGGSSDSCHSLEEKLKKSDSSNSGNSQDSRWTAGGRKPGDGLGTTTPELVRCAKDLSETSTSGAEVGMRVSPSSSPDSSLKLELMVTKNSDLMVTKSSDLMVTKSLDLMLTKRSDLMVTKSLGLVMTKSWAGNSVSYSSAAPVLAAIGAGGTRRRRYYGRDVAPCTYDDSSEAALLP